MSNKSWIVCGAVVALIGVGGCGKDTPPTPRVKAPAEGETGDAAKKSVTEGPPGSIKGKVTFAGEPPKVKTIDLKRDMKCAAAHATPLLEEWLLAGEGNSLGNVIVEVRNGPKAWRAAVPQQNSAPTFLLDQKGCVYIPHCFAIRAGTTFEIRNSDDTDHNVHFHGEANKGKTDNVSQPKGAPNIIWPLPAKEDKMVSFRCDVHPWMASNGRIVDHESFFLTKKDGGYELTALPPGDYTFQAWHESFEKPMTKKVTIEPGAAAEWNPVFKF